MKKIDELFKVRCIWQCVCVSLQSENLNWVANAS